MATLSTNPHSSFHPFPHLPKELRLRIWTLAAFEPRLLNLLLFPIPESGPFQYPYSTAPVPTILHACQESRSEALAFCMKAFSTGASQRYVWTNFNVDTIKIKDHCLSHIHQDERARIRSLIVEVSSTEFFVGYFYPWDFMHMEELRDLEILSTPDLSYWGDRVRITRGDFQEWFGEVEGWRCPEIRIVEEETGIVMNLNNFQSFSIRGRGRGALIGGGKGRGGAGGRGVRETSPSKP